LGEWLITDNLVLAKDEHQPRHSGFAETAADGGPFGEGPQRIGFLFKKKDKWWHLKDDDPPIVTRAWRPSSYGDPGERMLAEEARVHREVKRIIAEIEQEERADDVGGGSHIWRAATMTRSREGTPSERGA
jgi:hypothetical protein